MKGQYVIAYESGQRYAPLHGSKLVFVPEGEDIDTVVEQSFDTATELTSVGYDFICQGGDFFPGDVILPPTK